ncbi:MAG: response regulator [Methanotrichaceae archaeon]
MAKDSINNMRILLADDNESNRKVAMLMLSRLGYEYDAVSNGREAIKAVSHNHYDIVLMDIVMPEMDGLEAALEMRKLGLNGLKIIGITAYVVPGIREMCLEAGMDDCITKPMRIKDLEIALKKY